MMATHWTVGITSEMLLIVAQEFGGTVMMTISLNLVIYLKGFIIERLTNPQKKAFNDGFLKGTFGCLYQNKPFDGTDFFLKNTKFCQKLLS